MTSELSCDRSCSRGGIEFESELGGVMSIPQRRASSRNCDAVVSGFVATLLIAMWVVPANAQAPLRGVGTTFASPILGVWTQGYQEATGERVEYDGVAPGAEWPSPGRPVDFTVSDDRPILAAAAGEPARYPLVIGGIVPVANIDGIAPGQLRLNGPVLADIYLGRVRKWNDDAIRELNPAVILPNANITVVYRSDASNGTLLWTSYLANQSSIWRSQVGMSVRQIWPIGVGGMGNEGVASLVQRTRFSIGYADYFFVRQHRLRDVALNTRGGRSVRATHASLRAAVASPDMEGWPMVSVSSIVVEPSVGDASRQRAIAQFACWATTEGATLARDRYFIIPPNSHLPHCRTNE